MRVLVQQFYAKLLLQHYYYWAIHDVAVLYLSVSQTVRTNTPKSGNKLLGGVAWRSRVDCKLKMLLF